MTNLLAVQHTTQALRNSSQMLQCLILMLRKEDGIERIKLNLFFKHIAFVDFVYILKQFCLLTNINAFHDLTVVDRVHSRLDRG